MTNVAAFKPRKARRRPRLAAAVVEDLVTAIVTQAYPPGSALPPEGALCNMFEVSRTVVREATTTLTDKGLVAPQQGRGTIVQDLSHWSLLDPIVLSALFQREDGLTYLDSLVEIRSALEAMMAAKAARNLTGDDAEALTVQLKKLENLIGNPVDYAHEDIEFHDIIMRISGDILSAAIINSIQGKALKSVNYSGKVTPAAMQETHAAHTEVYNAILARDAEGAARAARAVREHIESSWRRRRPTIVKG